MYFIEEDLDFLFKFKGKKKPFLNDYNEKEFIILKENLEKSISKLFFEVTNKSNKLSNNFVKSKLEKEIKKIKECLDKCQSFDYNKWLNKEKPSDFSHMKASEFKLCNLTDSFNRLLLLWKTCLNSYNAFNSRSKYQDGKIIEQILNDYNECFQKIGIYGLSAPVAEEIFYGMEENENIDPTFFGFNVNFHNDSEDYFQIYSIPFFIDYPFYRSLDNKFIGNRQVLLSQGSIYYNENRLQSNLDNTKLK